MTAPSFASRHAIARLLLSAYCSLPAYSLPTYSCLTTYLPPPPLELPTYCVHATYILPTGYLQSLHATCILPTCYLHTAYILPAYYPTYYLLAACCPPPTHLLIAFRFQIRGKPVYFANRASAVSIGSTSFRNPPHFMESTEPTQRDAVFEVEALLDHLFFHDNTAPFVAYRLIQRFTTSNPSPRYVLAVANAFSTGSYGGVIHSGRYGCLAATAVAILSDREARSEVLDEDPTFGRLEEPLLKVIRTLRSLEFETDGLDVELYGMDDKVGQQCHWSPSVFNYYLPEYQPSGRVASAGLVSPEAQLGTAPTVVNFLNGMSSLIKGGLTKRNSGFGRQGTPVGFLTFAPHGTSPSEVVSELDLLLTRGQLSYNSRSLITAAVVEEEARGSAASALQLAQQLVTLSAEFHSTAANTLLPSTRPVARPQQSLGRRYKALVVLFLAGAADTFNLIVPHSGCAQGSSAYADLASEYRGVRTLAALDPAELLPISVPVGSQPCSTFGVHGSLPKLKVCRSSSMRTRHTGAAC